MRDFRKYIGPPSTVGPLETIILLFSVAAFVLALIGMSAPHWRTFASVENDYYSLGLWSACRNGQCFYAWTEASPIAVFNNQTGDPVRIGWYFSTNIPTLIATAEAMFFIALILHIMSCACWAGGPLSAAIALILPAVFYTIGMAAAVDFFLHPNDLPNKVTVKLEWGYAATCMFACVILIWVALAVFLVDSTVRHCVWRPKLRERMEMDLESMNATEQVAEEKKVEEKAETHSVETKA